MKVKVINLNLWFGGKLFDSALSFIVKENPDILLLQEVYDGKDSSFPKNLRTLEILKKELNLKYFYFSPAFLEKLKDGKKVERGNAVFSKFPIKSKNTIFYDIPYAEYEEYKLTDYSFIPRNLQHVVIRIEDKNYNVFNTQGIWGFDGRDSKRRIEMSNTIIKATKDKENVVLAGDFNVNPDTKTVENIEHYFVNVFKDELTTSFNMNRKSNIGYATAVVDMIFISRNLKAVSHYCPNVDISDHLPLVCTFDL